MQAYLSVALLALHAGDYSLQSVIEGDKEIIDDE